MNCWSLKDKQGENGWIVVPGTTMTGGLARHRYQDDESGVGKSIARKHACNGQFICTLVSDA